MDKAEAKEFYEKFMITIRENQSYNYLIIPYLFDLQKYDEIIRINGERERFLIEEGNTVTYAMTTIKRSLARSYEGKGDFRRRDLATLAGVGRNRLNAILLQCKNINTANYINNRVSRYFRYISFVKSSGKPDLCIMRTEVMLWELILRLNHSSPKSSYSRHSLEELQTRLSPSSDYVRYSHEFKHCFNVCTGNIG